MKKPSTDRRSHERYDVVGPLWGVLELPEPATIVNVSTDGLLIETSISPAPSSVQTLRLPVDGDMVSVEATVRHARSVAEGRHRVGLAFSRIPTAVTGVLEQIGAEKQIEVIDSGTTRP